jgi:hypothetical protein
MERMHAAIGKGSLDPMMFGSDGRGVKNSTGRDYFHQMDDFFRLYFLGIIMSMHLFIASGGATGVEDRALSLITSYENGCVKLWRYRNVEKERSIEGIGWECLWSSRQHVESGERKRTTFCCACSVLFSTHTLTCATATTVMATAISPDQSIAVSVSADHLVGRYELKVCA